MVIIQSLDLKFQINEHSFLNFLLNWFMNWDTDFNYICLHTLIILFLFVFSLVKKRQLVFI